MPSTAVVWWRSGVVSKFCGRWRTAFTCKYAVGEPRTLHGNGYRNTNNAAVGCSRASRWATHPGEGSGFFRPRTECQPVKRQVAEKHTAAQKLAWSGHVGQLHMLRHVCVYCYRAESAAAGVFSVMQRSGVLTGHALMQARCKLMGTVATQSRVWITTPSLLLFEPAQVWN